MTHKQFLPLAFGLVLSASGGAAPLSAQQAEFPMSEVALDDLDAFRSTGANWRIAGKATADRHREQWLTTAPGSGVLANLPGDQRRDNLFTDWEHGDLELELEFLMPKGSNSGIYLQGRYEIQLLDSWGVRNPTFADAGGIYQRWDESRGEGREGYQGHPPRVNASRAPGLWQQLRIVFRAPRFDEQGRKVANARFVRVVHNGVVVHENVEVTGPTRAAAFEDERPSGPLMIQGDHGPVALRNIRYKRYSGEQVRVADLRYRAYEGEFEGVEEILAATPVTEGEATGISSSLAGAPDKFALAFQGTLDVPTRGNYLFDLHFNWVTDDPQFKGTVVGGGRMLIDGREVLVHEGRLPNAVAEAELRAGKHPFTLIFYKNRPWINHLTGVTLFVEGPQISRHALHSVKASFPRFPDPIGVEAEGEPVVLRGFVQHRDEKRTHAAFVGDTAGVHYSFDVQRGALLHAWRGPFVEATRMWNGRGESQLSEPLGSVLNLSGAPTLAFLPDLTTSWPESREEGSDYRFLGYALDQAGRPTFEYRLQGIEVTDQLDPTENGTSLKRELHLRRPGGLTGVYARLARGETIRRLQDGSFEVDDLSYYVEIQPGAPEPVIRQQDGGEELLVPVRFQGDEATLAYKIIW